jgi:hypothetical protein
LGRPRGSSRRSHEPDGRTGDGLRPDRAVGRSSRPPLVWRGVGDGEVGRPVVIGFRQTRRHYRSSSSGGRTL